MSEQFALEQRLWQRGARDVHERLRGTTAVVVDDFRRQIFARAALACEQHGGRGARRHFLEQRFSSRERLALSDNAIETEWLRLTRPQRPNLAAQPRRLQRLLHEECDLVQVKRLVRKMVCAVLHRLDGGVDTGVRRQQHDEGFGVALLDAFEHRQPVIVRQSVIEQDQVDALVVFGESSRSRFGLNYTVPIRSEPFGERPANQLFVIDDEDAGRPHDDLVYRARHRLKPPPAHAFPTALEAHPNAELCPGCGSRASHADAETCRLLERASRDPGPQMVYSRRGTLQAPTLRW